uniref:Uncharacterized protein n=1 Tax=Hyaloperonospora arabidopsidis (strain Emoy2) TaxID=559515 RepID=M4BGG5_HYAAE
MNTPLCRRCRVGGSAAGLLRSQPLVVGADDTAATVLLLEALLLVSLLLRPL